MKEDQPIFFEFLKFFPSHWYIALLIWVIIPLFVFVPCFISFKKSIEPQPLNSNPEIFSEERAKLHLKNINFTGKAVGTKWNDETRDYIFKTLESFKKVIILYLIDRIQMKNLKLK